VLAALLAAGCGQNKAPLQGSAEPTKSPTASLAAAPALPAVARAHTSAGASAYTRYWFAALTYGIQSGDTKLLTAASDTATCSVCRSAIELVRANYSDGGRMQGGSYTLQNVMAIANFAGSVVNIAVTYDRSPRFGVSPLGVSRDPLDGANFAECDVRLVWAEGRWRVRAIDASNPIA
jgi:hypothetical protein